MHCFTILRRVLLVAFLWSTAQHAAAAQQTAPPGHLVINTHERIADIRIDAADPAAAQRRAAGEPIQFSLTAFGKTFQMQLQANDSLIADLPSAQQQRLAQKVKLYRGSLAGVQGSWVHLAQAGAKVTGMIWDGTEIYIIDRSEEVSAALVAN